MANQPTELSLLFIQVVAAIPAGRVATYGQIAKLAGYPGYARQVGATLNQLPRDTALPWFRVLSAQECISLPADSEGYCLQRCRLEDEGVTFRNGKVSLREFGWQP